ncbi:hypothetical protein AeRB84_003072 [Aphanomyces euteiches]|nr:hypothetical protein AeRB84_003072 [Aphanomyces euteiches]
MKTSASTPYSPTKDREASKINRKRSFRALEESSNHYRTRAFLIPLAIAPNPTPALLQSSVPPKHLLTLQPPRMPTKTPHRKPQLKTLPAIEPNHLSNNVTSSEMSVNVPTTTPLRSSPHFDEAPTISLDHFYTSEFHTTLSTKVNLAGWVIHDSDLAHLARLHEKSPPTQQLQHLFLNECTNFSDDGLKMLGTITSLRTLHCKLCIQLNGTGLFPLAPLIVDFDATGCPWIQDTVFAFIVRSFVLLQSLCVAQCVDLTNQGLFALADRSHLSAPLIKLDISGCVRTTDTGLLVVLTHCPKLELLRATHLPQVEGLTLYACLPQQRLLPSLLTHIDLSNTKSLHFSAIPTLAKGCGRRLTHLNLAHANAVSDDSLIALGRCCPYLLSLTLTGCNAITDYGIIRLVENVPVSNENDIEFDTSNSTRCIRLRSLDLSGCFRVTTDAIVAIATHCTDLTHLMLHGLQRVEAAGHQLLSTRCRHLTDIGCGGLLIQSGAENFFAAPKLFPKSLSALFVDSTATTIHLNKCACDPNALVDALRATSRPFRDLQLGSLANDAVCEALCNSLASLSVLNLSRSRHFTTASLQMVIRAAPMLVSLDVQHCDQLSNSFVVDITKYCRRLENLNVAGNVLISDAGLECLLPSTACPLLRSLQVKGCPLVSKAHLNAIAATHPLCRVCTSGLEPKPYETGTFLQRKRQVHQAACQVVAWMRQSLQRYREKELKRRLMWTRLRFRHQCAGRIQRLIREVQSKKREIERQIALAKELAERQEQAALTIQRYMRVYMFLLSIHRQVAAKRAADAFDAAVRQRNKENAAARVIQATYRYFCGRIVTLTWQKLQRDYIACRNFQALQIQRLLRGRRGRAQAKALLESEQKILVAYIIDEESKMTASLTFTRLVRGFLGRRQAAKRLIIVQETAKRSQRAASVIQRAFRAYFASVALRRLLNSNATCLQSWTRGWIGRRHAKSYVLEMLYASPVLLCLLAPRSIFHLPLAEQWQAKRNAATVLALSFQRMWRGYLGRVKAAMHLGRLRCLQYNQDVAARRLQRFFAHIRTKKRLDRVHAMLERRNACATKIQATWRMWLGKVKAYAVYLGRQRRTKHEVVRAMYYQSVVHKTTAWTHWRLVQEGAIQILVAFYRGSLRSRGWLAPSAIRHRYQRAAHIQAWVRGYLTRRAVQQHAARMHAAARVVQRGWHRKVEWSKWRATVEGLREKRRLEVEEDRASGIAKMRMKQYANEMLERQNRSVVVLQRTYRMWKRRQIFKKVNDARVAKWKAEGGAKLSAHMDKSCTHEVFRAQVWMDTMAKTTKQSQELYLDEEKPIGYDDIVAKTTELQPLNLDEEVDLLEKELRDLTAACHTEYATYEALAAEEAEIIAHVAYFERVRVSPKLKLERERALEALAPFATQGKRLILETTRLANENQRLKFEIIRLDKMRRAFYQHASDRLSFDPLLYELDIDRMVAALAPQWQPNSMHLQDAVTNAVKDVMSNAKQDDT